MPEIRTSIGDHKIESHGLILIHININYGNGIRSRCLSAVVAACLVLGGVIVWAMAAFLKVCCRVMFYNIG